MTPNPSPALFLLPGIPALAVVTFTWGLMVGAFLLQLLLMVLTWVVATRVTAAVLRTENKQFRESMTEVVADVKELTEKIATLGTERAKCELLAAKTFATRDQLAHVLVEVAANHREAMTRLDALATSFRQSVGKAHGRVDGLQERVTRTEERQGQDAKHPK